MVVQKLSEEKSVSREERLNVLKTEERLSKMKIRFLSLSWPSVMNGDERILNGVAGTKNPIGVSSSSGEVGGQEVEQDRADKLFKEWEARDV